VRRRDFIAAFGGVVAGATASPLGTHAQQPKRIGLLMNGAAADEQAQAQVLAFTQQLRRLGWVEGKNLQIDGRWNAGDAALARKNAAELLALPLDAILASTTNSVVALQRLSPTAPIVFIQVSDPVTQGFVVSMARPGGNITGFSAYEFSIGGKWLDLLKQLVPAIMRVGVMFPPDASPQSRFFLRSIEAAAPTFGVNVVAAPVQEAADIEPAIANISRQPNSGLIVSTGSIMSVHRQVLIEAAARYHVPAIYPARVFVLDGGLLRYGYDQEEQYRQAGVYVDRILRGTKAGDLPVQTPTKFSLAINLKAARALGIDVPMSLLLIADEQID
jgi:putative ABC transport system substrate-binding protein